MVSGSAGSSSWQREAGSPQSPAAKGARRHLVVSGGHQGVERRIGRKPRQGPDQPAQPRSLRAPGQRLGPSAAPERPGVLCCVCGIFCRRSTLFLVSCRVSCSLSNIFLIFLARLPGFVAFV